MYIIKICSYKKEEKIYLTKALYSVKKGKILRNPEMKE